MNDNGSVLVIAVSPMFTGCDGSGGSTGGLTGGPIWTGNEAAGCFGGVHGRHGHRPDVNGTDCVAGYRGVALDSSIFIGTSGILVTKHDSSCVKQFAKQLGAAGVLTEADAVATDVNGNMTGYTDGDSTEIRLPKLGTFCHQVQQQSRGETLDWTAIGPRVIATVNLVTLIWYP